jgi:hypothetical protein
MGGSLPPVTYLSDHGLDCLMVGIASDLDNFHSEDEHIEVASAEWHPDRGAAVAGHAVSSGEQSTCIKDVDDVSRLSLSHPYGSQLIE